MIERHADFTPCQYPCVEPEDGPAGGGASPVPGKMMERQTILPHIRIPFPVIVRARDSTGARVEARGVLDHLSARDLYVCLDRAVPLNGKLLIVIRFSLTPALVTQAPGVAVQGAVQGAERLSDGRWGMAITFARHYFLYAAGAG